MTCTGCYLSGIINVLQTMNAGRLKVKYPYRHTGFAQLTGVTWVAVHNSGMVCFTFNCHTWHNPPHEVRDRSN